MEITVVFLAVSRGLRGKCLRSEGVCGRDNGLE